MELTAFTSRLGEGQGRLGPGVFVLGDDEPGRLCELAAGDHVEVSQDADLTGATLVRVALYLRLPQQVPTGVAWEVAILVDGVKYATLRPRPGSERSFELSANVSKVVGIHSVSLRLGLV
jgi:hypothetical protein